MSIVGLVGTELKRKCSTVSTEDALKGKKVVGELLYYPT